MWMAAKKVLEENLDSDDDDDDDDDYAEDYNDLGGNGYGNGIGGRNVWLKEFEGYAEFQYGSY